VSLWQLACIGVFSGYVDMTRESRERLEEYYERHAQFLPERPEGFFSPYVRAG